MLKTNPEIMRHRGVYNNISSNPSSDVLILLKVLHISMDENGNHSLHLLILRNPSGSCHGINLSCVCGCTVNDGPPSCLSKQGTNLMRPSCIVRLSGEDSSMGWNSGVDVERHVDIRRISQKVTTSQ